MLKLFSIIAAGFAVASLAASVQAAPSPADLRARCLEGGGKVIVDRAGNARCSRRIHGEALIWRQPPDPCLTQAARPADKPRPQALGPGRQCLNPQPLPPG